MSGYIHFTDEQKQRANSVDLVDFLKRQGEQLMRSGREWRWKRHDSVTIRGNQWFRHSSRQGGLAIDFMQEFYDLSFPDAVTTLLNGEEGVSFKQSNKKALESERKEFLLPEAAKNMRRVYAYLLKQRYIDRDVLTHFVREKKIFEGKEYHNAIFIGFDEKGNARHAHKRGTYSNCTGYWGNVEGSDPRYSFNHIGKSNILFVFEAPVDMLSYISLYKKNWQQHSYVNLDGVAEHAMLHVLQNNEHLHEIVLCLDHDAAGIEATGRLQEILNDKGHNNISVLQPKFKDWNEDLKSKYGITPIPAQEHPKIEACRELCGELRDLGYNASVKNPHEIIIEHFQKFKSLTKNEKVIYGCKTAVMVELQNMAFYAILATAEQYRQIENPVSIEQLTEQLYKNYYPHKDRCRLKVKRDNIQQDIDAINNQFHTEGIRTLDDKQKLISSYKSLASNCIKTHIFMGQEIQKQKHLSQNEQAACEEPVQPKLNLS